MAHTSHPLQESFEEAVSVGHSFSQIDLIRAIQICDFATVKHIVEKAPAFINTATSEGETMFRFAVRAGNLKIAQYLVDHGADYNVQLNNKLSMYQNPVYLAIQNECYDFIPYLKTLGFSLTELDKNKLVSPLERACSREDQKMVEILLDEGADPFKNLIGYKTVMDSALDLHQNKALEVFVRHPKTSGYFNFTEIRNEDMKLITFEAIERGNNDFLLHLFDQGLSVNIQDAEGLRALHHAVMRLDVDLIKELLNRNADINKAFDHFGRNPFHLLCVYADEFEKQDFEEIFALFIDKGADIHCLTYSIFEMSARDYAQDAENFYLVNLIDEMINTQNAKKKIIRPLPRKLSGKTSGL